MSTSKTQEKPINIDPSSKLPQLVGVLCQNVIDCLKLPYQPCNIYIGLSNIEHIRRQHLGEYAVYLHHIPEIIQNPDYVGVHPKQGGVEYIKRFETGIMVSVRMSSRGVPFVRSLYEVSEARIEVYLAHGTLVAFPKQGT